MVREIARCRICANENLVSILNLGEQCLTGVFPKDRDHVLTRGPLELVKCCGERDPDHCGLVQLRHVYDSGEMYGDNYGYRSSLNRSMVEHLGDVARRLLGLVPLRRGDLVLDIGSNDGTLLSCYPADGPELVGMDPTAKKFGRYYPPHARAIAEFFSAEQFKAQYGDRKARIVTSIAMFYDLDDPAEFMRQVREILAADGIWHLEQSYLPTMLAVNAYDTICHEHVEYYALRQIKHLTDRTGLKIIDVTVNDVNGGSFAVTVARREAPYPEASARVEAMVQAENAQGVSRLERYEAFQREVVAHREKLLELLRRLRDEGQSVLGYGASTKGNVILQFCGITSREIACIAEVNPDKFGCYTPGSKIPIISETEARAMNPGYFLALPWHFKPSLLRREAAFLRSGGKMIFPLPRIEVVAA
jgi:NDP-4-keto-2,6-dideoxyhexose 3-C-methyltransferase